MKKLFNLSDLSFILFVSVWALAVGALFFVPLSDSTPIHWDISGEPDGFAPGWLSVLLPAIIGTATLGFIAFVSRSVTQDDRDAGRASLNRGATIVLIVIIVVELIIILNALGQGVPILKTVSILIGGVLIALGDILPKSQPNSLSGIRLPHTMNSADVWRITHRWAGRFLIISGAILILVSLFIQHPTYLLISICVATLLPLILSTIISYRVAGTKNP